MTEPLDRNDPTAEALGRAVEGLFRVEKEIGRGGMGVVYLAVDEQLARRVAIKTLPPHLSADANVRERFLREARTAGALSHPGIVPIYTAAERDGVVYFVMRWIDGESLADKLAANGPMTSDAVLSLLGELTHALGYAHAQGVVHRDIKAENVLIERKTGRAVITDFGIARVAETQPMTATGTVLGSVHYMSPEQVTGETLDGRSDLYALGVLGYHALTCRFPFERPMPSAVLVAHVNEAPPRVSWFAPDVSPKLERILTRLLEKQPAARFASAETLRNAIDSGDVTASANGGRGGTAVTRASSPSVPADTRTDAPALPDRLSSVDAQQVWARAAELQAHTGVIVPPPMYPSKARAADATRGYDMVVVRESAVDAGIDEKYVERALAERAQAVPVGVVPGELMQRKPNWFAGALTRIEYEGAIDGELTQDGFEEIADEARRALGEMVQVSAVGRTLTITTAASSGGRRSAAPRQLQITVTSRNGRTTVHGFENLLQQSQSTFAGMMGAVGGGGGSLLMGITMATGGTAAVALPLWAATFVGSAVGARFLFQRTVRTRSEELQRLIERVLARARYHVK